MLLAIDTSSALSGVALIDDDRVSAESVKPSGRGFDVAAEVARLVPDLDVVSEVLVALGPGSFTGLRQGIAFGVGLAMSLQVPLLGLGSLDLAAARAREPAVAVSEAGRGRFFYQAPDGRRGVAEAAGVPREWPVVGWLRTPGLDLLPEARQRGFGEAVIAARSLAKEVGYGTVKADYMRQFGELV